MNSTPTPPDSFEPHEKPNQPERPSTERSLHTDGITPGAQPPIETTGIHQGKRREIAAGLPAVEQTLRYAWGRMGVVKGTQALLQVNQKDGFNCQSCAWPSPDDHRSFAEFCENGAKAVSDEGTRKRVTPEFFAQITIPNLLKRSDHWLNEQGRLTHPMVRREGSSRYEPIQWEEAFALIGSELRSLDSPDQAAFYTSGRTSNEAAYLYQLFVRLFGTNNLPDCSNMCHESSGSALSQAIGIGKGTVTLDDFLHTDAIFVAGQNPGSNHPRMLTSLQSAKARGAKLVSVNPLPETGNFRFKNPQDFANPFKAIGTLSGGGTQLSDLWLPVKINGDLAFFKGLMKELLAEERKSPGKIFDLEFIKKYTNGYEELIESLERADWSEIIESSGLNREQIRQAAQIAMNAKSIICCWAMGLTQHKNAVATIREIANFLLLRGNIGKKGAGACPVRGHSNVQGDRTVGIWDRPTAAFLDKLGARYHFDPPSKHGAAVVDTIMGMHRGSIKVFFGLGGNFLSATPDTEFTAEALSRCSLTVQVSTKLNRSHLITGRQALILPCLGRSEIDRQASGDQLVTIENSMGIINPSRGTFEPASEHLLSEVQIVARLARAVLGERSTLPWEKWASDYSLIRTEIESVIPGFDRFNERIAKGTFYLPNAPRDRREFRTQTGKANFTVNAIEPLPLEPGQYVLMTMRSHDQFNTTIYGLNDRYRGIYNGRRVIFMNRDDMKEAGFVQGQPVDITSHFEGVERRAERYLVAPYSIPRRCVAVYFPEGNVLVPVGSFAEKSKTPVSKSVCVTLAPSPNVAAVGVQIREEATGTHPLAQPAGLEIGKSGVQVVPHQFDPKNPRSSAST
jgi:molybdopterin-dependent oxidoreductase alpha subunit